LVSVPSVSRRVKITIAAVPTTASILFSLGVFGLHTIDARSMAAQVPAKCEKGQWTIQVPRTHIKAPYVDDNKSGPALATAMIKYPQFSLNSIIAANQGLGLKPSSYLPAVSGGILCLNLPTVDKAQNSVLVISNYTGKKTSHGRLNLNYRLPTRLTDEQIVSVHYKVGFRGNQLITISAISMAESGGVTNSVCKNSGHGCNATWATAISFDGGLDQINNEAWHISINDMFNPLISAKTAKHIVDVHHGSFRAWTTFNHGYHKKFLNRMRQAAKQLNLI
jgi:hypothetical protein